jgi:hypothetical protein
MGRVCQVSTATGTSGVVHSDCDDAGAGPDVFLALIVTEGATVQVAAALPSEDLADAMRQFIIDQGEERTDETRQRYAKVADDLMVFLETVDVAPWLGPEIADHLEEQRRRDGRGALWEGWGWSP